MAAAARPRRAAETVETRARVAKLGLDPELGAESSYRLQGARQRRARCALLQVSAPLGSGFPWREVGHKGVRHGGLKGWGQSCRSQYNQRYRERQALGSGMCF